MFLGFSRFKAILIKGKCEPEFLIKRLPDTGIIFNHNI